MPLCSHCQKTFYPHPSDIALLKKIGHRQINDTLLTSEPLKIAAMQGDKPFPTEPYWPQGTATRKRRSRRSSAQFSEVPTLCPSCRLQRRMSHRNERHLYKRACDFTKKNIISVHAPDAPWKVYSKDIWWSDKWDAREYGQPYNFNRPFFAQFAELQKKVPRMSMILASSCENADYAPYSASSRNCYLSVSIVYSEDIYYSYQTNHSKDCVDCALTYNSELCYECIYGFKLYASAWTSHCRNSSNLYFCQDCQSCDRCIGCVNLKNKKLHIFNKPVSEETYKKYSALLTKASEIAKLKEQFEEHRKKFPMRENHNISCENVTGDYLINSKNCRECFEAENLEDCAYISVCPGGAKDCMDVQYSPKTELLYEVMSGTNDYHCQFVLHSWDCRNSLYIDECQFSSNLFGCIGLKRNEYCILNKQYTQKEYEELLPRIIAHMKNTKEWGEFFPTALSLFAYNETIAQDFFPLTSQETQKRGWKWRQDTENTIMEQKYDIPDDAKDTAENITNEILSCRTCKKPYKIIPQELELYKKMSVPLPRSCPSCRHTERMKWRVPRKLTERLCGHCGKNIHTAISGDQSPIIFCEECYILSS